MATDGEIAYELGRLDDCRLITVVYPRVIDLTFLSDATARYLSIWEIDEPTVQMNDVTRCEPFDEIRSNVLLSMLRRNATRANYWGSAYWMGDNEGFVDCLTPILVAAQRSLDCIQSSLDDALEYLRRCIQEHCSGGTRRSSLD
jgi:hypothetical protein